MANSFQLQTKSGKPVINKETKLPEFTKNINQRISAVYKELNINTIYSKGNIIPQYSHEQRWEMIKNTSPVFA